MAEIEKREKELNTKLHRLARKEESLAQKERTIQEKLQDLSQQSRMYEGEQLQGWRTLPTLLSNDIYTRCLTHIPLAVPNRGISRSYSVQQPSRFSGTLRSLDHPSITIPTRDGCSSSLSSSRSAVSCSPSDASQRTSVSTDASSVSSLFSNDDDSFYDAITNLKLAPLKTDKACHIHFQRINEIPSPITRTRW